MKDVFLRNAMDSDGFVSVDVLLSFPRLSQITSSRDAVVGSIAERLIGLLVQFTY